MTTVSAFVGTELSEEEVRDSISELTAPQLAIIWGVNEGKARARCRLALLRLKTGRKRMGSLAITWEEFDHVMSVKQNVRIARWLTEEELEPVVNPVIAETEIPNHVRLVTTGTGKAHWICRVGYNGMEAAFMPSIPSKYKTKSEALEATPVLVDEYTDWFESLQEKVNSGEDIEPTEDAEEELDVLELAFEIIDKATSRPRVRGGLLFTEEERNEVLTLSALSIAQSLNNHNED